MPDYNTYLRSECVAFHKTKEAFGGLSNMAASYPVFVNGTRILTTEHLYQACRFPDYPDLQKQVLAEKSPMGAKMKSKPHRHLTRLDWETPDGLGVRVDVMRWCLRLKLAQNLVRFRSLLLDTGSKPIVEISHKDRFWGAVSDPSGVLVGSNMLGRLLVELRESLFSDPHVPVDVPPPSIENFLFLGEPIRSRTS